MLEMVVEVKMPCKGHRDWHFDKNVEIAAPRMALTPCILDEDPGQLEGLAAVIGEMGYEPIPTTDPEEALRLVRRGRCRLLLADLHMPGMRRYEFLDQVLRCDPGSCARFTFSACWIYARATGCARRRFWELDAQACIAT